MHFAGIEFGGKLESIRRGNQRKVRKIEVEWRGIDGKIGGNQVKEYEKKEVLSS